MCKRFVFTTITTFDYFSRFSHQFIHIFIKKKKVGPFYMQCISWSYLRNKLWYHKIHVEGKTKNLTTWVYRLSFGRFPQSFHYLFIYLLINEETIIYSFFFLFYQLFAWNYPWYGYRYFHIFR